MRNLLCVIMICLGIPLIGQTEMKDSSQIVEVPDVPARFPGCESLEGDEAAKRECANKNMLSFLYQNIRYPQEAIQADIEGSVVVRFVVEKDGSISNAAVLKDIGGGCGDEALRVVMGMNEIPQKWTAALKDGEVVRSYFTVPIKFKLEEPPDFTFIDRDSVWLKMDKAPAFKGGDVALDSFVSQRLSYPEAGNEYCRIGEIEIQLLVKSNGVIRVTDLLDYSGLGIDFMYEAIALAHQTFGKWEPAEYEGRKVPATVSLRFTFLPTNPLCENRIDDFETAVRLNAEALQLYETEKSEEAIFKWDEVVALFPDNAEYLSFRGQALIDVNRLEEACSDLSKARNTLWVTWYNHIIRLICAEPTADSGDSE